MTLEEEEEEGDLADGLELGPGVGATHFQRRVIVENVVAKIFQRRLGVCGGKLSCVLNLFPYLHINLLQKVSVFSETAQCLIKNNYFYIFCRIE